MIPSPSKLPPPSLNLCKVISVLVKEEHNEESKFAEFKLYNAFQRQIEIIMD